MPTGVNSTSAPARFCNRITSPASARSQTEFSCVWASSIEMTFMVLRLPRNSTHGNASLFDAASAPILARENLGEAAPEPAHDLLQAAQGDALGALFEAVQGRGRQAELPGELGVSHLPAPGAQKFAELVFLGRERSARKRSSDPFGLSRFSKWLELPLCPRFVGL